MSAGTQTLTFQRSPKRILLVLHGSIGDVTRALPLVNCLRRGFPKAYLAWAVEPPSFPLVEHYPGLDEVLVYQRTGGWRTFFRFLQQVRNRRFDLVLDLQRHLKSGFVSLASGAQRRIGFARQDCKEFNWLFNNEHIPVVPDRVSKLQHYLKFVEYLGVEPGPPQWLFDLANHDRAAVAKLLEGVQRDYAAMFVGSRWESKRWFPDQIGACARILGERFGIDTVLLGIKQDQNVAAEVQAQYRAGVTNLVGRTSLREAIGIIDSAKLAIGPDTGLMHLSAALGTPVISLWGATSPSRTGPYGFEGLAIQGRADCSPCYLKHCPIGRRCMRSIGTEEIAEKIAAALALRHSNVQANGNEP